MTQERSHDKGLIVTDAQIYHDALRETRLAIRYADGTEEDKPLDDFLSERDSANERAAAWHQAVETASTLLGLGGGLSPVEFLTKVQALPDPRTAAPYRTVYQAPSGFKLLPQDPTDEMLRALEGYYAKWHGIVGGSDDQRKADCWSAMHAYRAMYEAAEISALPSAGADRKSEVLEPARSSGGGACQQGQRGEDGEKVVKGAGHGGNHIASLPIVDMAEREELARQLDHVAFNLMDRSNSVLGATEARIVTRAARMLDGSALAPTGADS